MMKIIEVKKLVLSFIKHYVGLSLGEDLVEEMCAESCLLLVEAGMPDDQKERRKLVSRASSRILYHHKRLMIRSVSMEEPGWENDGWSVWNAGFFASGDRAVNQIYARECVERAVGHDDEILSLICDFASPFDAARELKISLPEVIERRRKLALIITQSEEQ